MPPHSAFRQKSPKPSKPNSRMRASSTIHQSIPTYCLPAPSTLRLARCPARSTPWPPQGLFSKKLITSASDLKGIKWRAYSPATARIADLVSAQPVTVQAAELSQALATGVVEATMTSSATGVDSKLFEHLKYFYDLQAWLPKNLVIVNKKSFDSLDKSSQDALLKAAASAEARGLAASKRVNQEAKDKLKANGIQIMPPSPQLTADMKKVGDTMLKEWLEKAGPDGKTLLDTYRR